MNLQKEIDHPFPNEEMLVLMKLQTLIDKEDLDILANLLSKYLDLRAEVFHEMEL